MVSNKTRPIFEKVKEWYERFQIRWEAFEQKNTVEDESLKS